MNISQEFKRFLPHIFVIFGCILISLVYFSPVLEGKKILQSDIVQYVGTARQQTEFRDQTGEEPYWTDSVFGGMPTYQLGAQFPHYYIKKLDKLLRFLPRPADYLFLYLISFYILLIVLKVDWRLAFLGSLAFGFSTYLIVILGVGHNAKAHAIGYMPLVLSGVILTFRKKYVIGFLLLTVAMGLELVANHVQMTYYLGLLIGVLGIGYLYDFYKKQQLPEYFKAVGIMMAAVFFSLLLNATNLLATKEYAAESTRGKSNLTINPDGSPKSSDGLTYEYITQYSSGLWESFNLFIPRFMGGSSIEKLSKESASYKALLKLGADPIQAAGFVERAPTYWGKQPFLGGVPYIGAVTLYLFVLGLFLIKGKHKWWLVGGSIISLVLSWGHNFALLTNFFIDVVPLYDKFRAVTSIQVILELCVPILGVLGLQKLFFGAMEKENKIKAIKWSIGIVAGTAIFFLLAKNTLFSFSGAADGAMREQMGAEFVDALREGSAKYFCYGYHSILNFCAVNSWIVLGLCRWKTKEKLGHRRNRSTVTNRSGARQSTLCKHR